MLQVQEALDEEGITQKKLFLECGLSDTTVSKICTNSVNASSKATVAQIVAAINREVGEPKYRVEDIF